MTHYSLVHTACHGKSKSWEVPQEYRPPFRDLSFLRLTDGDARWTWEVDELHLFYTHSVNIECVHSATGRSYFCALLIQNRAKSSTTNVQLVTQSWSKLTICALRIQTKKSHQQQGRKLDPIGKHKGVMAPKLSTETSLPARSCKTRVGYEQVKTRNRITKGP